jgi:hypothetical protein
MEVASIRRFRCRGAAIGAVHVRWLVDLKGVDEHLALAEFAKDPVGVSIDPTLVLAACAGSDVDGNPSARLRRRIRVEGAAQASPATHLRP